MWLTKVHTSQEAPTFISGSSSLEIKKKCLLNLKAWVMNWIVLQKILTGVVLVFFGI